MSTEEENINPIEDVSIEAPPEVEVIAEENSTVNIENISSETPQESEENWKQILEAIQRLENRITLLQSPSQPIPLSNAGEADQELKISKTRKRSKLKMRK